MLWSLQEFWSRKNLLQVILKNLKITSSPCFQNPLLTPARTDKLAIYTHFHTAMEESGRSEGNEHKIQLHLCVTELQRDTIRNLFGHYDWDFTDAVSDSQTVPASQRQLPDRTEEHSDTQPTNTVPLDTSCRVSGGSYSRGE